MSGNRINLIQLKGVALTKLDKNNDPIKKTF